MPARRGAIYREKRYLCGPYVDVYIYPVYPVARQAHTGRCRRRRPSREVQKKLNIRHATEKLTRKLHANFTDRDLAITLTWAVNPPSDDVAKQDLQKYLGRLRYRYRKRGSTLKYIWSLERSGRGRYHVHLVLSGGMDRDELEQLWTHGYANSKRLQTEQDGLAAMARYITKSHRDGAEERVTFRSYNCSKNLIDPEPQINDSRISSRKKAAELADEDWNAWHALYPEYELVDIQPFHSDEYGSVYIFARLRRVDGKGKPKGMVT